MPSHKQQRLFLVGTEHATLDPKNVLALRTLFAVAHRLGHLLGESWQLVLGTVNCLDCILNTPRKSAQVSRSCCTVKPMCCSKRIQQKQVWSDEFIMAVVNASRCMRRCDHNLMDLLLRCICRRGWGITYRCSTAR